MIKLEKAFYDKIKRGIPQKKFYVAYYGVEIKV